MATKLDNMKTDSSAVLAALSLDQLSFTARGADDRIELWTRAPVAGDWASQCRTGREFASEAMSYISASGDAALLPGIVRTIAERGTFGGVEAGFFAGLSVRLIEVEE